MPSSNLWSSGSDRLRIGIGLDRLRSQAAVRGMRNVLSAVDREQITKIKRCRFEVNGHFTFGSGIGTGLCTQHEPVDPTGHHASWHLKDCLFQRRTNSGELSPEQRSTAKGAWSATTKSWMSHHIDIY